MATPGEIYSMPVTFEDDPSQSKTRPVLILRDLGGGDNFYVEITSQKPKGKYHDQFKKPFDWKTAGLPEPSWVKSHKTEVVNDSGLGKYWGSVTPTELTTMKAAVLHAEIIQRKP